MDLAEKVKHLRSVEGELRGLGRPMTQMEVVKAMQEESGREHQPGISLAAGERQTRSSDGLQP